MLSLVKVMTALWATGLPQYGMYPKIHRINQHYYNFR